MDGAGAEEIGGDIPYCTISSNSRALLNKSRSTPEADDSATVALGWTVVGRRLEMNHGFALLRYLLA